MNAINTKRQAATAAPAAPILIAASEGSCGMRPASLPRPKPISVNGIAIPRAEIARETQNHPAAKPVEAWQKAARALVVRELLVQEARRLGFAPEPLADGEDRRETEDEALVRMLIEREVRSPEPDEATCRRIYERKRPSFRSSDLFAARHILFAARPGDPSARATARADAEAAIVALQENPARFSELASAVSACTSRNNGGALGQISRGQTVPEFEAALAQAPVGRLHGVPVETRYGFHVLFVDHKVEGEPLPFELVRDAIAERLTERAQQTAIRQYISMLAGRAKITGIDIAAAPSTLAR